MSNTATDVQQPPRLPSITIQAAYISEVKQHTEGTKKNWHDESAPKIQETLTCTTLLHHKSAADVPVPPHLATLAVAHIRGRGRRQHVDQDPDSTSRTIANTSLPLRPLSLLSRVHDPHFPRKLVYWIRYSCPSTNQPIHSSTNRSTNRSSMSAKEIYLWGRQWASERTLMNHFRRRTTRGSGTRTICAGRRTPISRSALPWTAPMHASVAIRRSTNTRASWRSLSLSDLNLGSTAALR